MKYIDLIKQMSVDELAMSLKIIIDGSAEKCIQQFAKENGININFKGETNIEDIKFCLLSEVSDE